MTDHPASRVIARVTGRVQGVNYRATARREARLLGLAGWVRNEPDGSVLIDAEGDSAALEAFLDWCRCGPPLARVDRVEETPIPPVGYQDFTIS
jgi:acylphosphatase